MYSIIFLWQGQGEIYEKLLVTSPYPEFLLKSIIFYGCYDQICVPHSRIMLQL